MFPASRGLTQHLWSLRSIDFDRFRLCQLYDSTIGSLRGWSSENCKIRKMPSGPRFFRGDPVGFGDRSHAFPGLLGGLSNLMYGIFEIPHRFHFFRSPKIDILAKCHFWELP